MVYENSDCTCLVLSIMTTIHQHNYSVSFVWESAEERAREISHIHCESEFSTYISTAGEVLAGTFFVFLRRCALNSTGNFILHSRLEMNQTQKCDTSGGQIVRIKNELYVCNSLCWTRRKIMKSTLLMKVYYWRSKYKPARKIKLQRC